MNSRLKGKKLYFKLFLGLLAVSFYAFIDNWSQDYLEREWEKNNNFHPVKCAISNKIDSVGPYGRGFFVLLDDGRKFGASAEIYGTDPAERNIHPLLDSGDSLIKRENSRKILVKKHSEEIQLYLIEISSYDKLDLDCGE